jgi:hypothetical protein
MLLSRPKEELVQTAQVRNPRADPPPELKDEKPVDGKLVARPVCGELHHDYRVAA